jgi:O-antigen/teichoic acid export membrane protein
MRPILSEDPLSKSSAPTSFRNKIIRASVWTLASHGLGQALRLISNLIMTRLLVPEMFGVMTIALLVSTLLAMFSDVGISQNIVQSRRGNDPLFLNTAWVLQIVRGFFLWSMAALVSILLVAAGKAGVLPTGSAYASPELPIVIAVCSLTSIIQGFQSTKMATAQRGLEQGRLTQNQLIAQLTGLFFMILIAFTWRSVWALVSGTLIAAMVTTVLSHIRLNGHANRLCWDNAAARELLVFGKWVVLSSSVYVLAANGDRLLMGALVDARVLGLYSIAALIIGSIEGGVSRLFSSVALPAFSEIARNDPSRLREIYYRFRVPSDLLLLFLAGLLFPLGQLIVDLLYDERYAMAGSMLQILAVSLFMARYTVAHQVYLAVGMPRYWAIVNFVRFVALYAMFIAVYHFAGTSAVIWVFAFHGFATLPFVYRFNSALGIWDLRREAKVLVALPVGYVVGMALVMLRP